MTRNEAPRGNESASSNGPENESSEGSLGHDTQ
jgi:hypothetical protein